MIINRNSWHYRWIQFVECHFTIYAKDPSTLCSYFWRFVGRTMLFIFAALIKAFFVSLIPVILWAYFHNHSTSAGRLLLILTLSVSWMGILIGYDKYKRYRRNRPYKAISPVEPQPLSSMIRVVIEYSKAVKNKVCPLIKYEE